MKSKTAKRGRRSRPPRNNLNNKRNAAASAAKKAALTTSIGPKPQQQQLAEKIMVSGLPTDVSEGQIKVCIPYTIFMIAVYSIIPQIPTGAFHNNSWTPQRNTTPPHGSGEVEWHRNCSFLT